MTKAKIIAHNLKQLRARENWSQAQLAEAVFANVRTIRRYESGTHESFDNNLLVRLAQLFGVNKHELESNPNLVISVDHSSITDGGATLQFKKPKEKKEPVPSKNIRELRELLMTVADKAPYTEDEELLLEKFRELDEMRQTWILFLVTGSEEMFQRWMSLYQEEPSSAHRDSMSIMHLKAHHLHSKR